MKFDPIIKAIFLERPNRFVVWCHVEGKGRVEAFLPNPGRLWELLLPRATLYLKEAAKHKTEGGAPRSAPRRTRYTVMAVEREGAPVFLHTHRSNAVARYLLERRRIPTLEEAEVVGAEVTVGRSRFDFLLREKKRDFYLEVKSVTLFGNGVAMFPDAITERGRRHLLELAALSRPGARPVVLFLVHAPRVRWFMPDYHTDLEFGKTLLAVRRKVRVLPVAIQWHEGLRLGAKVELLDIPWDFLRREVRDRGSYLLALRLGKSKTITIGKLGAIRFTKGYHIYVGSAMGGLEARIARHRKREKKPHWHIDYLRREADDCVALPIRSSRREECAVARAISSIFPRGPKGFGSSDCRCATHLFHAEENPLELPSFHSILQRFRMRAPGSEPPAR